MSTSHMTPAFEVETGIRPRALASQLGMTERTIYRWIGEGKLDVIRVGRNIFITAESVQRLFSQGNQ